MPPMMTCLAPLFTIILLSFASATSVIKSQHFLPQTAISNAPVLPQHDPFYRPPQGYEKEPLGAVLRYRRVQTALNRVPFLADAYQILYRTSTVSGGPLATVTTVFIPPSPKQDRFLSYQVPEDSAALMCAPSYNFLVHAQQTNPPGASGLEIEVFLREGYITSSPDYEGPDSAFAVGRLAGMGVLDGMRAVADFGQSMGLFVKKPAVVGFGYSGGAIATGWAASLHPKYARDLNVKAFAFGGTPANVTGTSLYIDGGPYAGFIPIALEGLRQPSAYKAGVSARLGQVLTRKGHAALHYTTTHCASDDVDHFKGQRVQSRQFTSLGQGFFHDETIQTYLNKSLMAVHRDETPTVPIMMAHGNKDEIIPYSNATHTFETWCKYGASVDFLTVDGGTHGSTAAASTPHALLFIERAFDGGAESGCRHETIRVD